MAPADEPPITIKEGGVIRAGYNRDLHELRTIATDLVALQDPSGAIREVLGGGGTGIDSNAEYGTRETSLIQSDGDRVCDMLYSCNHVYHANFDRLHCATGGTS